MKKILILITMLTPFIMSAQQKVLNGRNAMEHEFPWMGTLELGNFTGCGCTLIDPEWVLTAAHCAWGLDSMTDNYAIINPYIQQSPKDYAEIIPVEQVYFYPGSEDFENLENETFRDIALIKLAVTSSYEPIQIATPADEDSYHMDEYPAQLLGWGLDEDLFPQDTLLHGQLIIIDPEVCSAIYAQNPDAFSPPKEWEICAGYKASSEIGGAASGDSGGPLFVIDGKGNPMQVGIVSRGDGGPITTLEGPGIYTHVASLHEWIKETMSGGPLSSNDLSLRNFLRIKRSMHVYSVEVVDLQVSHLRLSLLDLTGRIIDVVDSNTSEVSISIQDLPSGIYILDVQTENGHHSFKINK